MSYMMNDFTHRNVSIFKEVVNGKTLKSVGNKYDISDNRVNQIVRRIAIKIIRKNELDENINYGKGTKSFRLNKNFWIKQAEIFETKITEN